MGLPSDGSPSKSALDHDSFTDDSVSKEFEVCSTGTKSNAGPDWAALSVWQKTKLFTTKLLTEGHTFKDGVLVVAACQIGQIMLVMPRAMWMTGVVAGLLIMVVTMICGAWTVYLLICFFQEYKGRKLMEGTWYDSDCGTKRRHVTQYHEVMKYFVGPWLCYLVQAIVLLVLLGTGVAQILACSSDYFYLDQTRNKRTYEIIWGGVMVLFAFVPSFSHMRIFNIVALTGTLYTNYYLIGRAGHRLATESPIPGQVMLYPRSMAGFFGGGVILMSALGGHVISMELIEVMKNSHKFFWAYCIAEIYTLSITMPHSVIINFAYPDKIGKNDNVYGVMPQDIWLTISVWLMIIHQMLVFALVMLPVFFMAEKVCGVHTRSIWLRYLVRIPIVLLVYFVAVAFPFYSSINGVIGALGTPAVSFVIPCLAYNWLYRTQASRDSAAMPPPQFFKNPRHNWNFAFGFNFFVAALYGIGGCGFGIFYAFYNLVMQARSFGLFPECYQCPKLPGMAHIPALAPHAG